MLRSSSTCLIKEEEKEAINAQLKREGKKNVSNARKLFISLFLFGTASKKTKLINNNNKHQQQQHQNDEQVGITNTMSSGRFNNGKVHQQQQQTRASTLNSPVDVEHCANQQDVESLYNGDLRGPRLVNKQLVLPIITFPKNSATKDSNHLIKPSEYLKSITTDKRMITGNRRYKKNIFSDVCKFNFTKNSGLLKLRSMQVVELLAIT